MISRKNGEVLGSEFPGQWKDHVSHSFQAVFEKKYDLEKRNFEAFGLLYSNELLVILSLVSEYELSSPISVFLSVDLKEGEKKEKVEQVKNLLLDVGGIIYQSILKEGKWSDYQPNWEEADYKKQKYFFKITRENIALTIEANKLLQQ